MAGIRPGHDVGFWGVAVADLDLSWGGDLGVSPVGDLLLVGGDGLGVERVLRRLLSNPGDLVFHAEYGAGLAGFVGGVVGVGRVGAVIRAQAVQESAVARSPTPEVEVEAGADGIVSARLRYTDAASGTSQVLVVQPGG